jgi:hypothetical protein
MILHVYKKTSSMDAPLVKEFEKNKICRYCGMYSSKLTRDHVKPKSHGYTLKQSNQILCCYKCNQRKGSLWLGQWITEEFKSGSLDYSTLRENIQKVIDISFYLDPDIFDEWNDAMYFIDNFH